MWHNSSLTSRRKKVGVVVQDFIDNGGRGRLRVERQPNGKFTHHGALRNDPSNPPVIPSVSRGTLGGRGGAMCASRHPPQVPRLTLGMTEQRRAGYRQ